MYMNSMCCTKKKRSKETKSFNYLWNFSTEIEKKKKRTETFFNLCIFKFTNLCFVFYFIAARSTINNNLGNNAKKDIKESTDSNITIEDEEGKLDRISKSFYLFTT